MLILYRVDTTCMLWLSELFYAHDSTKCNWEGGRGLNMQYNQPFCLLFIRLHKWGWGGIPSSGAREIGSPELCGSQWIRGCWRCSERMGSFSGDVQERLRDRQTNGYIGLDLNREREREIEIDACRNRKLVLKVYIYIGVFFFYMFILLTTTNFFYHWYVIWNIQSIWKKRSLFTYKC